MMSAPSLNESVPTPTAKPSAQSQAKRPRVAQTPSPDPSPPHPRNVSREVFLLTGGMTPAPLVPVIPNAPSAAKPVKKRQWEWKPFRNSARKDALKLAHWAVAGSPDSDYTFARFNKRIRMVTYTEKEWDQVVSKVSPASMEGGEERKGIYNVPKQQNWTKEETDTLFELCDRFDLRFIVIHDRWPQHLKSRNVDELKDRYYSVAKAIVESRGMLDGNTRLPAALHKHCQAINMNAFDYEYESMRKNQLQWQYGRSKTELKEEEETVREARRIEANRKRLVKEKQRLAKLITPAGDVDGRLLAAAATSTPQKTFPHRKVVSGAYARSSLIYTPVTQSARVSRRIDEALNELGVGTRPTPTSIVVDNFDLLRMDIVALLEWQRTVLKKEEDNHSLRVKLAKLRGDEPPQPPPGVALSHKKRRAEEVESGSLFGAPPSKQQKTLQ